MEGNFIIEEHRGLWMYYITSVDGVSIEEVVG